MTIRRRTSDWRRARFAVAVGVVVACEAPAPRPATGDGVVAAASPEAARAGVEVLALGGNAIDAAIAVQFVLAVTEPAMSGLGGQTQIVLQRPGETARVINGTSRSPRSVPEHVPPEALERHRATTVPSTVNTLAFAHRTFGSGRVEWRQLLAPAIRYADEGFEVGPYRARVWARHAEDLRRDSVTAALFLIEGRAPEEGDRFRQPVLAETLRRIARGGADDFYRGEIAREIARDMAEHQGWVTQEDLSGVPEPEVLPAITTTYRGLDVASLPPPGGGWVVLQLLNVFEQSEPLDIERGSAGRLLRIVDALRLVHTERRDRPVEDLTEYDAAIAERVNKDRAAELWAARSAREAAMRTGVDGECASCSWGETTHFSVVDADGMAVGATASINAYFGARAASGALGFLYNDYMHEFQLDDPGHPFALRGNAMPYSSMSPTIVSRDGLPIFVAGSPGSARIPSAVAQVIQLWVDEGVPLVEAVAAPRLHVVPDRQVYVEAPTAPVRRVLNVAGYELVEPATDLALGDRNAYFGGVHALALEGGGWTGAADPRRDGAVASVEDVRDPS